MPPMTSSTSGRRRSFLASAAAALVLLTGCGDDGSPATEAMAAPVAAATAAPPATPATPTSAPATPEAPAPAMAASRPVSLNIPAIGAQSELLELGLRGDGSLEVPPGDPGSPAGWYIHSPAPGERGPAVLLGHVNATDGGSGVFADLRQLEPGDRVEVTRKDGTTAVFTVERGEQYAKDSFPTEAVYGNTEGSELRLITCDGYDPSTGQFEANYVVYAKLVP